MPNKPTATSWKHGLPRFDRANHPTGIFIFRSRTGRVRLCVIEYRERTVGRGSHLVIDTAEGGRSEGTPLESPDDVEGKLDIGEITHHFGPIAKPRVDGLIVA